MRPWHYLAGGARKTFGYLDSQYTFPAELSAAERNAVVWQHLLAAYTRGVIYRDSPSLDKWLQHRAIGNSERISRVLTGHSVVQAADVGLLLQGGADVLPPEVVVTEHLQRAQQATQQRQLAVPAFDDSEDAAGFAIGASKRRLVDRASQQDRQQAATVLKEGVRWLLQQHRLPEPETLSVEVGWRSGSQHPATSGFYSQSHCHVGVLVEPSWAAAVMCRGYCTTDTGFVLDVQTSPAGPRLTRLTLESTRDDWYFAVT